VLFKTQKRRETRKDPLYEADQAIPHPPDWGRRIGLFALATVVLVFAIYHAEPILQGRIIDTLSARFHSRVELPEFHVSVAHGLQVSGRGLKIFRKSDLNIHQPGIQPLITVDEFRFGTGILNFLRTPMRVHRVYLKGLELN
jgi:hypothetical protein